MIFSEPSPILDDGPRYSSLPLPPYRYVPGLNPHPRRDPSGHSYGTPEPPAPPWLPEAWRENEAYLHGIDLYNRSYWWECHEVLEGLWAAAGRTTPHARFVRGIILVAAASLNRHREKEGGGKRQAFLGARCVEAARPFGAVYMGVEIDAFASGVRESFERGAGLPPILLIGTSTAGMGNGDTVRRLEP